MLVVRTASSKNDLDSEDDLLGTKKKKSNPVSDFGRLNSTQNKELQKSNSQNSMNTKPKSQRIQIPGEKSGSANSSPAQSSSQGTPILLPTPTQTIDANGDLDEIRQVLSIKIKPPTSAPPTSLKSSPTRAVPAYINKPVPLPPFTDAGVQVESSKSPKPPTLSKPTILEIPDEKLPLEKAVRFLTEFDKDFRKVFTSPPEKSNAPKKKSFESKSMQTEDPNRFSTSDFLSSYHVTSPTVVNAPIELPTKSEAPEQHELEEELEKLRIQCAHESLKRGQSDYDKRVMHFQYDKLIRLTIKKLVEKENTIKTLQYELGKRE